MNKQVKELMSIVEERAAVASWSIPSAPKASLKQMALHFDTMLNGIVTMDAEAVDSAEFAQILPNVNRIRRAAGIKEVKVEDFVGNTDGAKI